MRPLVYYTSLLLGLLFLAVAVTAWIDVFDHGDIFSNPLVKPAAGWLMTGLMFLAVGLRGWRARIRKSKNEAQTKT
jgi:hypothetical protein